MQSGDPALRKRQQIAKANKMMFLWVAAISVVVGVSVVLSIFLFQKLLFNEKVLNKKRDTASTLVANNKVVGELKKNALVLNTNQALLDSRSKGEGTALQTILDALPSDANTSALGSSLQNVLLPGDDIRIESLTVDSVGDESESSGSSEAASNSLAFSFAASAPTDKIDSLRNLLLRLERSIRAIDVKTATVEIQGSRVTLNATANAFYEPAKSIELKTESVKPNDRAKR